MIYDDDRATMVAPWPISAPSSPGEGSRFMLTIDKVHQRRVWDSGNFETPPASPIPPLLSLPSLVHVGSSVTCDCVTSITRGTGEWIKQIGSRRRVTRRAHAWIHSRTHARTHTYRIRRWTWYASMHTTVVRSCGYTWPLVSQAAEHRLHLVSV